MQGYGPNHPAQQLSLHRPPYKEKPSPGTGFLSLNDLAAGQGELMLTIDFDPSSESIYIEACMPLPQDTQPKDIVAVYLSLCNLDSPPFLSTSISDTITIL